MKRSLQVSLVVVTIVLLLGLTKSTFAQQAKPEVLVKVPGNPVVPTTVLSAPNTPGTLIIPKSSVAQVAQPGKPATAHTNIELFIPNGFNPDEAPPFSGYGYQTPASLACHYGLVSTSAAPNCNPNTTTVSPTGGSQSIAIVDAYDDPAAPGDLAWFSLQFGVPLHSSSQFQVIWANTINSSCNINGVPVDPSGGWEVEESLDIEYSHAMAPNATIYLVEACSNYLSDLQQAVLVANNLVQCGQTEINPDTLVLGTCPAVTSAGEVSMSWGGGEYSSETGTSCGSVGIFANPLNDGCFTAANVVYFASTGDGPGVIYPSTSPNVVAAGGTTLRTGVNPSTNAPNFDFLQEAAWVSGGGGASAFEVKPSYQTPILHNATAFRGVPDLSSDADPYTGVWVYDTFPVDEAFFYEWVIVGGTSVSAPTLAGIINNAATVNSAFAPSSAAEINNIYNSRAIPADITNITTGFCGPYMSLSTLSSGWNFCTGVGVVNGYAGK